MIFDVMISIFNGHVNWFMMSFTCVHDCMSMITKYDKVGTKLVIFCQSSHLCIFSQKYEDFDAWVLPLKPGRSQHRAQPAIFRPQIGLLENKRCHVEISVVFCVITPLRLDVKDR